MRTLFIGRFIALLIVLAVIFGRGANAANPTTGHLAPGSIDLLLRLMQSRLMLMHDVARWKWNERRPIEDAARERELLDKVTERGRAKGLAVTFVRSFFASQVEAAKLVQRLDFDRWQAGRQGPFRNTIELASLRERIDELDHALIEALVESRLDLSGPARREVSRLADQILVGEGLDRMVRDVAIQPLEGTSHGSSP
jgi:chorismate mutase